MVLQSQGFPIDPSVTNPGPTDWKMAWQNGVGLFGQAAPGHDQAYMEGSFEGLRDFGDVLELYAKKESPFAHVWESLKESVYEKKYNPARVVFESAQLLHVTDHLTAPSFSPQILLQSPMEGCPSPVSGTFLQLVEFCRVNMKPQVEGMIYILSSLKNYYQTLVPESKRHDFVLMWELIPSLIDKPDQMIGPIEKLILFLNQLKWVKS